MKCSIFSLNYSLNFQTFSSNVYILFYLMYYFDDSLASIFFHVVCYVFLYEFYSFYCYCLLICIFCVLMLCSQFFLLSFNCLISFPGFSLLPWFYFVHYFIIFHYSFLELCLSLKFYLSVSVWIYCYNFCIYVLQLFCSSLVSLSVLWGLALVVLNCCLSMFFYFFLIQMHHIFVLIYYHFRNC